MPFDETPYAFESDVLRLSGLLHRGDASLAALVLHPHPQYGGDMHNHVVGAVCETLAAGGATTLRFDFRGVGASEGGYAGGRGEADDARAALAAIKQEAPGARVILAGYSFGAAVAAAVAPAAELAGLILISPPVSVAALPELPDALPTLVVAGERDSVAPAGDLAALATPLRRVVSVPGVDHSWWPGVDALASELSGFVAQLAPV